MIPINIDSIEEEDIAILLLHSHDSYIGDPSAKRKMLPRWVMPEAPQMMTIETLGIFYFLANTIGLSSFSCLGLAAVLA